MLTHGKQYEYYKLTSDWCGKNAGTVFKVALDQSSVQWHDGVSHSQVELTLSSPLLKKLPELNITEFMYKGSVLYTRHKTSNHYRSDAKDSFLLDEILENNDFKIHAVKNAVGIEFSVGEKTANGRIQSFDIQKHHEIHAVFNDGKNYSDVNVLEKLYYSSDKVLLDWEEVKQESPLSVQEWQRYLQHNHDNMLSSIGVENITVADCFDMFHYNFLVGPLTNFFIKFEYTFQVTWNETKTHFGYVLTLPTGEKKRNSGKGDFDEPLFPSPNHAHSSAVRSLFVHLNNQLVTKSRDKLGPKE